MAKIIIYVNRYKIDLAVPLRLYGGQRMKSQQTYSSIRLDWE